jgi:hypothetical protein
VLARETCRGVARIHRAVAIGELRPWHAAQPSGSDSPMTIGLLLSSGYEAIIRKPSSIVRR